jgi:hypothetical protein
LLRVNESQIFSVITGRCAGRVIGRGEEVGDEIPVTRYRTFDPPDELTAIDLKASLFFDLAFNRISPGFLRL